MLPPDVTGSSRVSSSDLAAAAADDRALHAEMRDYLSTQERRRRVMPRALLVGALAGLTAVAFRRALDVSDEVRSALFAWTHRLPWVGILIPLLFCAVMAALAVWLVRCFAPEAAGSGIPNVESALHDMRSLRWQRILPVKFVGGVLGMNAGLALGREGPTIQMGASVGQMVASWFGHSAPERRTLIAAGAAAGLAAAFNAPLAGLVFVVEELQRDFGAGVFTAAFMSAVSADLVMRFMSGQAPIFRITITEAPPLQCLPLFFVIGLLCGVLGLVFNRTLLASLDLFSRFRNAPAGVTGLIAGLLVGLVGWFLPASMGDGHHLVERSLREAWPLQALAGMFLLRFALTMVSYGSGAPGGIFAPLLVLGAQAGLAVGEVGRLVVPSAVNNLGAFAVVGMAAYFTAIVRAPLTGIVLITEMTGNYHLMFALLTACLAAYAVADAFGDVPIYEALLQRDLSRSRPHGHAEETVVMEFFVHHGAAFSGLPICKLGLPPGCLFIKVHRTGEDIVPTAQTVLHGGDRLVAVISADAPDALRRVKIGTDPDFERTHDEDEDFTTST